MGFEQYKKPAASNTARTGSNNLGGAAVELIEKNNVDGKMVLTAKLMFDSISMAAGTILKVVSHSDTASKNEDNLKKGMGSSQGSVLILENCVKVDGSDDTISTRWITTAKSSTKAASPDTGHAQREIDKAFIAVPTVFFKNPVVAEGEPLHINWSLTAPTSRLRGPKGYADYDRAWFMSKISQVKDHKAVRVAALALQPTASVKVDTLDAALETIKDFIGTQGMAAFVRIRDENNGVESVIVRNDYSKTPDVVVEDLKAAGLFRNVPNEAVADEVAKGNWVLEVMPGIEIPFLGDSLQRIVSDLQTREVKDLVNFNINYGDKRGGVTEAILVTLPTSNGNPMFCHDPIRVNSPRYSMRYLPSPHFDVVEPAATAAAAPAADANAAPAAGGEDFSGDAADYDFQPADAAGNTAPGAGAGFEDDKPSESASRQRMNNRN